MSESECLAIVTPTLTKRDTVLSARPGKGGKPIPGRLSRSAFFGFFGLLSLSGRWVAGVLRAYCLLPTPYWLSLSPDFCLRVTITPPGAQGSIWATARQRAY